MAVPIQRRDEEDKGSLPAGANGLRLGAPAPWPKGPLLVVLSFPGDPSHGPQLTQGPPLASSQRTRPLTMDTTAKPVRRGHLNGLGQACVWPPSLRLVDTAVLRV